MTERICQITSSDQKINFTLGAKSTTYIMKHEKTIKHTNKNRSNNNSQKANTGQTETGKLHYGRISPQKQGKPQCLMV